MDEQVAANEAEDARLLAAMSPEERAQELAARAEDKRREAAKFAARLKRRAELHRQDEEARAARAAAGIDEDGDGVAGGGAGGGGAGGAGRRTAKRSRRTDEDLEVRFFELIRIWIEADVLRLTTAPALGTRSSAAQRPTKLTRGVTGAGKFVLADSKIDCEQTKLLDDERRSFDRRGRAE